ncbi:NALCN channel auxiliary factor 2 [Osmerus mordax]|uniref:NALCN channel auxiliary factor 2 n=1 Tax=Osmerus mordax TaxID=8014 RepID=UPI0035103D7E
MIRGAWMFRKEDDAVLKICCAPKQNDKPCADSERVQKWRMSLASLLFFTVLLSDHLWLCAGVKLRSKDRSNRKIWSNATDGIDPGLNEEKCGIFLSNLTKSAPSPHCTAAQSHTHLETACTALYRQKTGSEPSSPTPSALSSQIILDYFRNFSLSFCDSYTISDLLLGMSRPDSLNCSLQNMVWDLLNGGGDDEDVCSVCTQAYMRLDQHAQEKYEEFDLFFLKYLSEDYSVRSRTEDCRVIYKAWLCSEYFNATQSQCHHRIPCKQYCLEVQTKCPFVLPDNDDLVYGGLSSFICTGLLEQHLSAAEPECCDVRWAGCASAGEACALSQFPGSLPGQQRSSPPVSSGPRLCGGGSSRMRLCVLVLFLLHTVVSFSSVQSGGALGLEAMLPLEESSAREE